MRTCILLVGILGLVSACTGTDSSKSPQLAETVSIDAASVTPEYVASQSRQKAQSILSLMSDTVTAEIIGSCDHVRGKSALEACFDESILRAFEVNGALAKNCQNRTAGEDFQRCVLIGARLVPLAQAVGEDATTAIKWSALEEDQPVYQKLNALIDTQCRAATTEATLLRCSIGNRASLLGLTPAVAEHCFQQKKIEHMPACVHDSLDAAIHQEAIKRLSR